MLSKCGAQLLRACQINHAGLLLRSRTATKINFTRRTYSRTTYNSSSNDDGTTTTDDGIKVTTLSCMLYESNWLAKNFDNWL